MKDFGTLMLKEGGARDSPTGSSKAGAPSLRPSGSSLKRKCMLIPLDFISLLRFSSG